ncbi:hypothetical protein L6R49_02690 [Myxococcota bacterium]|nr:hypothetical protein [Myxococcota bacterium]
MSISRALLRHKALLAASSVVLAMTACVGGDEQKADDTSAVVIDTSGGDSEDSQPLDTEVKDTSVVDTSAQAGCVGLPAEEVQSCCEALKVTCDAEHGEGSEAAMECLYGEDFSGSTGCVPWGPPVPPRSRRALV